MKTKTLLLAILSTVLSGFWFNFASAGERKMEGKDIVEMSSRMVERLDDRLDLTGEQKNKVDEIVQSYLAVMMSQRASEKKRVQAIISAPVLSPEDAREFLDTRGNMRDDMQQITADLISAVHAILTPEQRVQAAEELSSRGGYRGRYRDGHRNGKRNHEGFFNRGWFS